MDKQSNVDIKPRHILYSNTTEIKFKRQLQRGNSETEKNLREVIKTNNVNTIIG